jgi:hypothetical protein
MPEFRLVQCLYPQDVDLQSITKSTPSLGANILWESSSSDKNSDRRTRGSFADIPMPATNAAGLQCTYTLEKKRFGGWDIVTRFEPDAEAQGTVDEALAAG